MKKEVFIIVIIIGCIIFLDLILTGNLNKKIDELSKNLENLETEINTNNDGNIEEKFNKVDDLWYKSENGFAFYLEHDELEKVGTELANLESSIESNEWNEAKVDIKRLQFVLEHLKEKMDLKLKNIF